MALRTDHLLPRKRSATRRSEYGLCVAFCEANDCDLIPNKKPNKKACAVLRANYTRITGELDFPCEVVDDSR
jgi:hypothetical protein